MSFWLKENKEDIKNIYLKDIQKEYSYKNNKLTIQIIGAKYSKIKDKEVLLDEVLVNKSIDEISKCIINNTSKYNSLPKKVVIYHEDSKENTNDNINKKYRFYKLL